MGAARICRGKSRVASGLAEGLDARELTEGLDAGELVAEGLDAASGRQVARDRDVEPWCDLHDRRLDRLQDLAQKAHRPPKPEDWEVGRGSPWQRTARRSTRITRPAEDELQVIP